jgi:NADH-quinone oxidoreductase subunit H
MVDHLKISILYIGVIRTVNQFISYELLISILFILLFLIIGSFRYEYFIILPIKSIYSLIYIYIIHIMSILAENNRIPFDLPESESETVSRLFYRTFKYFICIIFPS